MSNRFDFCLKLADALHQLEVPHSSVLAVRIMDILDPQPVVEAAVPVEAPAEDAKEA